MESAQFASPTKPDIFKMGSADSVCKCVEEITIDGLKGKYVGQWHSNLPCGSGVFVTDENWIHFGYFDQGHFSDGRKVSVNKDTKDLIVSVIQITKDGSRIE